MRISDWSSDVCSSDLALVPRTDVNGARPRFAQPVLKGVLPRNIDPLKKLSRICCNAAHLPNIDVHEREVEADCTEIGMQQRNLQVFGQSPEAIKFTPQSCLGLLPFKRHPPPFLHPKQHQR